MRGCRHLAERLGCFALPTDRHARFRPFSKNRSTDDGADLSVPRSNVHCQKGLSLQKTAGQQPDRQEGAGFIQPSVGGGDALDARRWTRILGNYSTPSRLRSIAELAITACRSSCCGPRPGSPSTLVMPGLHCLSPYRLPAFSYACS